MEPCHLSVQLYHLTGDGGELYIAHQDEHRHHRHSGKARHGEEGDMTGGAGSHLGPGKFLLPGAEGLPPIQYPGGRAVIGVAHISIRVIRPALLDGTGHVSSLSVSLFSLYSNGALVIYSFSAIRSLALRERGFSSSSF